MANTIRIGTYNVNNLFDRAGMPVNFTENDARPFCPTIQVA